jgi:hypothetical protein
LAILSVSHRTPVGQTESQARFYTENQYESAPTNFLSGHQLVLQRPTHQTLPASPMITENKQSIWESVVYDIGFFRMYSLNFSA